MSCELRGKCEEFVFFWLVSSVERVNLMCSKIYFVLNPECGLIECMKCRVFTRSIWGRERKMFESNVFIICSLGRTIT